MQFMDAHTTSPIIRDLQSSVNDNRCTLRWLWPSNVQSVYIHKIHASEQADLTLDARALKLYTKDEFKANQGYHDRLDGVGRWVYTIYASTIESGEPRLIRQPDFGNRIEVSTGKANIYYSIRLKSGLFQKFKTAQIQVTCEVPLSKDVLCYVKKQGGYPTNKEDGTVYPFVESFPAGKTVLPVIEIGKNDFIRLFFTDGREYGHMYALIPE
ncbi:beta-mannanase [Paenibacillus guangzhouensis]|uniref:beta-mannanase n=1 Tax=Paenibacillus guangzhouensis TaxID=1473112 RepID=UPI001266E3A9|nr:beta-mannanase [Paenibacillus guangzhouensis]